MSINNLGWQGNPEQYLEKNGLSDFLLARVIRENKERYIISNGVNDFEAEVTGNLRFTARSREDFPAVGDWVCYMAYDSSNAIIHNIVPRNTILARQSVGKFAEKQVIAANVDVAFIVQAVSNNFNINRLERYLSICSGAGITPHLILSKIDLVDSGETDAIVEQLKARHPEVEYVFLSNVTREGIDHVIGCINPGLTYCVMGSSGVGKSSLLNNLLGKSVAETGEISEATNKGKHVTSHRELFVLPHGGVLIDTPGMRELGITESDGGLEVVFTDITDLAEDCRYADCTHTSEDGCAVLEAVDNGSVDQLSYENYQKLQREQQWFESSLAEKRKKDKSFGKMVREVKKLKKERGE